MQYQVKLFFICHVYKGACSDAACQQIEQTGGFLQVIHPASLERMFVFQKPEEQDNILLEILLVWSRVRREWRLSMWPSTHMRSDRNKNVAKTVLATSDCVQNYRI